MHYYVGLLVDTMPNTRDLTCGLKLGNFFIYHFIYGAKHDACWTCLLYV